MSFPSNLEIAGAAVAEPIEDLTHSDIETSYNEKEARRATHSD